MSQILREYFSGYRTLVVSIIGAVFFLTTALSLAGHKIIFPPVVWVLLTVAATFMAGFLAYRDKFLEYIGVDVGIEVLDKKSGMHAHHLEDFWHEQTPGHSTLEISLNANVQVYNPYPRQVSVTVRLSTIVIVTDLSRITRTNAHDISHQLNIEPREYSPNLSFDFTQFYELTGDDLGRRLASLQSAHLIIRAEPAIGGTVPETIQFDVNHLHQRLVRRLNELINHGHPRLQPVLDEYMHERTILESTATAK